MRLLIYDTEMRSANGYLPRAIAKAAEGLLGSGDVRLCDHATVVGLAASGAWDGLLAIGGAGADLHLITALMETPILRILWTTEDPYERRLLERVEPAFHHVFSNELLCDGVSPRTTYLPLAAEPSLHHRPLRTHDSDYVYDLTFVGTACPIGSAVSTACSSSCRPDCGSISACPGTAISPSPSCPASACFPNCA